MEPRYRPPHRSWPQKFSRAFVAVGIGIKGQSSFIVHFAFALLVFCLAVVFKLSLIEWIIVLACIAAVLTAEMFNRALEVMAKAVTREEDEEIRLALDIASGAVLIAAIGATVIGLLVFVPRVWNLFAT